MLTPGQEPRDLMSPPTQSYPPGETDRPAPWRLGLKRGLAGRCPVRGVGPLLKGYVKPNPHCPSCGSDLLQYRADDAPAYFTILIVGHIVIPAMLMLEMAYHPPVMLHWLLWIPLTLLLSFLLLPRIKGALIGLQWALKVKS